MSHTSFSRSSRTRRLVAGAIAGAACIALAGAPAASAQGSDPTDGGRLTSSLSGLTFPQNLQIGSLGGPELSEVDSVDPARYAGKWYQVAAIPQPFTLQCVANTTADYGVTGPMTISVLNGCDTPFGGRSEIEGEATVKNPETNASLRVGFPGVPGGNADGPTNYRITYLADDYSLAIVGSPERASGFVLSRTASLTAAQWDEVRSVIADRGWNDCAFLTTPQREGLAATTPLCLT